MSDIIESMAKAICCPHGCIRAKYEPDYAFQIPCSAHLSNDEATAAYAAALAHLEKPSDRMIQSGLEEYMTTNVKDISVNGTCSRIFTAMIRAAK